MLLARDQKVDLRAGETRRAPSWVLQLLYSEITTDESRVANLGHDMDHFSRLRS